MANQTVGLNVQDRNPFNMTVTNSGTLISKDVELVYNQATVITREDLLTALEQIKVFLEQASGSGFGPP